MNRWLSVLTVVLVLILIVTTIATRIPTSAVTVTVISSTTLTQSTTVTSEQTRVFLTTVTAAPKDDDCRAHYPQINTTQSTLLNGTKTTEFKFRSFCSMMESKEESV